MSERNRIANTKNMYQGDAKRVLCVCSAGLLRSPTAANVLHREFGFNTRSAGCSEEYAMIPVSVPLLHWADEIVCMEKDHLVYIEHRLLEEKLHRKTLFCLNIPDMFSYMDEELQEMIINNYKQYRRAGPI